MTPKIQTKVAVVKAIRAMGLTAIWRTEWQEYRINIPGGDEATAYYTSDNDDALDTARAMARP